MKAPHTLLSSPLALALFALCCDSATADDDNATIAIGYQRGLAYLPVILMQ